MQILFICLNLWLLPCGLPQAPDYIRSNADTLTAVIVKPVQSRRPEFRPAEFIREMRRITENAGSLFIFDEVVTGFRFGPRGAHKVQPDFVVRVGIVFSPEKFRHVQRALQWQKLAAVHAPGPYQGDAWLFMTETDRDGFVTTQIRKTNPDYGWRAYISGRLRISRHATSHFEHVDSAAVHALAAMIGAEIQHVKRGK